jgi:hypothetical protein
MAKVVTERPRRGHGNSSKKWGRRLRENEYHAQDHGPERAPIARRHQYGWNAKEFSDLLDRCADTCESRSDVLGTRSGRRSFALSTAVH